MLKRSLGILGLVAVFGAPQVEAQSVAPRAGTRTVAPAPQTASSATIARVAARAVEVTPNNISAVAGRFNLSPAQVTALTNAVRSSSTAMNFRFNQSITQAQRAGSLDINVAANAYVGAVIEQVSAELKSIANVETILADAFRLSMANEVQTSELNVLGLSAKDFRAQCGIAEGMNVFSQAAYDLTPEQVAELTSLRNEALSLAQQIDSQAKALGIALGGYVVENARGASISISGVYDAVNAITSGQMGSEGAYEFFSGLVVLLNQQLEAANSLQNHSSQGLWDQTMENVWVYLVNVAGFDELSATELRDALGSNCQCALGAGSAANCSL